MKGKKEVTALDEKFDTIKGAARQSGHYAYELIALYVYTAIKNKDVQNQISDGLQKFIQKFGKLTETMKKTKSESHEIWQLFTRIMQIRDLTRNIFHGSVLNDILEGSHFSVLFVDAVESLGYSLGFKEAEYKNATEDFKNFFENQRDKNAEYRALAKKLVENKNFTESDAQPILTAYGVAYPDLQRDVDAFIA